MTITVDTTPAGACRRHSNNRLYYEIDNVVTPEVEMAWMEPLQKWSLRGQGGVFDQDQQTVNDEEVAEDNENEDNTDENQEDQDQVEENQDEEGQEVVDHDHDHDHDHDGDDNDHYEAGDGEDGRGVGQQSREVFTIKQYAK
ncbi:hypothetical protein BGZ65_004630 [Modicella reniformis]|uniref:Uncharacterized protein n=1 Tax=Modicella reniformis TaxID=1440133 RepID=A0A9P6STP1_9FUNG|nr:hypothetical protein BGZ65_004630 [Modicella reniformis]